ncbi:MAG: ABC tungstate transporter permease [Candidatus Hecatellales archaeon B24]|nr:MAG: ABC tungstate transporter permease [Candidatus Hecatellales archaeon B24]
MAAIILLAAFTAVLYLQTGQSRVERLTVATTTSLYDTGLLDLVEKAFEKNYPCYDIAFISAGTGIALQYASRGDADAVLVHAPPKEFKFMREGYGVNRRIIAYNFFLIVGPKSDPAGINGLKAVAALTRIVEAGRAGKALWISRGDESGTHSKEKALWETAGFNPERLREEAWYVEAGAGMGKTLLLANEKNAYTLSDVGTYLKYLGDGLVSLKIHVGESKELLNVYSIMAVNPEKVRGVNFKATMLLINFLTSDKGQNLLAQFGVEKYGRPLFNPAVKILQEQKNSQIARWIAEYGFMEGEECPSQYRRAQP